MAKSCSSCGLISPTTARTCECGFDFHSDDAVGARKTSQRRVWWSLFLGFAGLAAGALGFLLLTNEAIELRPQTRANASWGLIAFTVSSMVLIIRALVIIARLRATRDLLPTEQMPQATIHRESSVGD